MAPRMLSAQERRDYNATHLADDSLLPSQQRRRSPRLIERPTSPIISPNRIDSVATAYTALVETDPRTEASSSSSSSSSEPSNRPIEQQRRPSPRLAETIPPVTLEEDAAGATIVVSTAAPDHPLLYERPGARPDRPRVDPTITLQEHTRLLRVQSIVQQDEEWQESPPIAEFSALTIRDGPVVSAIESGPEPGFEAVSPSLPAARPLRSSGVSPSDAGFPSSQSTIPAPSSSPSDPSSVSSVGGDEPILSGYLQAIREQDTAGGPDFLRAQSDVYSRVLGTLFNHQCNCPNSRERAEPENTHTLQEYVEHINRSLPPLPAIFAERDQACDPRASFPQWHSFLSDQPAEPLSFRKTQASLPHDSVTIGRRWDVDSIWFGAKSLSAIRAPSHFRLSFFPPHKSNISTAQVIQPHGLDLAHTRHTSIGTFTTTGVRFSVLMFFPNGGPSYTKASANSLSLARFKDLYDGIILPAVYETVPDHVRQEIPSSYDLLYAKSRAYQENPGAGRWSAEDEGRVFRLSYSIPANNLPGFWASVVKRANLYHIHTRKGDAVPYFQNPHLLFQAHDLKNTFASQSIQESLILFRDSILSGLDASQIDMHSCWLDVGMRNHVRLPPPSSSSSSAPTHGNHHHDVNADSWTLLWKSDCCHHLHDQLSGIVPDAPMDATYFRSYILRDAETYYAKAKPSRAPNPGHPEARSPGIIRVKAYNCNKDLFGVIFSNYQLFSSGFLPLLALNEAMLKDLAATAQSRQRAFVSQLDRSRLVDAWDANKRHMRAISTLKRHPNFGIRKEVTFRLDVILAMWADGMLEPGQNPHTGPIC
ncbi:hypothetical protein DER46DRAFT_670678 [Fusarium sp. MPI-SDFR-AT-0072]|nr:hypothetical protein DER46DRAFT_670678 [Fusarium sp. MPI-SDFR-AT-0072]